MITRLHRQDGFAVPIAVILMAVMLGLGLAALNYVDAQTEASRVERTHESRLNLTEGVVAAQIFQLSRAWPDAAAKALPLACTQTSTSTTPCPQPAQLQGQFSAVDFKLNPTWDVKVRDNDNPSSAGQFYSDATILGRPTWDANRDGEMWVRAEGLLGGKHRVVVTRVRVEQRPVTQPAAPFVAGSFQTGNNSGNKVIVQSTAPGVVRCPTTSTNDDCIDYVGGQISPINRVDSDPSRGSALAGGMAQALKQKAIENNTYYATCPADPSGEVVWVESGNCSYESRVVNGVTKQGVFILNNGTLRLTSGLQWWGLIYALNAQGCGSVPSASCLNPGGGNSDGVVDINGTVTLHGGIYIEGAGRLSLGSSGGNGNCASCEPQLIYDPSAARDITVQGTAGMIQNTWRELLRG